LQVSKNHSTSFPQEVLQSFPGAAPGKPHIR